MDVGTRLKEERERLGYNQTDFAMLGGVGRKAQFNYESGTRSPDGEYLAAISKAGVDVLYVLTGQRSFEPPPSLTPRQKALLDNFEHLSEKGKRHVEEAGFLLSEQERGTAKRRA